MAIRSCYGSIRGCIVATLLDARRSTLEKLTSRLSTWQHVLVLLFSFFFCCQGSAIQNYDDSSNRVRYHLHVTKTYPVCLTFRTNYNVQFFSLAPSLLFVLLVSTASAYA